MAEIHGDPWGTDHFRQRKNESQNDGTTAAELFRSVCIYAQVIDDLSGRTLISAASADRS
jgi:hypothetical protein